MGTGSVNGRPFRFSGRADTRIIPRLYCGGYPRTVQGSNLAFTRQRPQHLPDLFRSKVDRYGLLFVVVLMLNKVSVQGPLPVPGWVPEALMEGLFGFPVGLILGLFLAFTVVAILGRFRDRT